MGPAFLAARSWRCSGEGRTAGVSSTGQPDSQLTYTLSDRPILFAAVSLFQQMFGLEVWMCLRYLWSLITTYPTTENCTYTGKLSVHIREHGWITLPQSSFILSPASAELAAQADMAEKV